MLEATVSYSELDAARQCGLKWYLAYQRRWVPTQQAPALVRGSLFHKVLEAHYRRSKSKQEAQTTIYNDADPLELLRGLGELEEHDLIRWVYEGYVEAWAEQDSAWEIVDVELPFDVPLPTWSGDVSPLRLKGRIDLLVRDHSAGGGLWVADHKTCRTLPKEREVDLDDQMALYLYALQTLGQPVRGAIYNACRTTRLKRSMTLDERYSRTLTVRTQTELQTVACEAEETLRELYVRQDTLRGHDVPSPGDMPPRRPHTDLCRWRCPYIEQCLLSRKGQPVEDLLAATGFVRDLTRH